MVFILLSCLVIFLCILNNDLLEQDFYISLDKISPIGNVEISAIDMLARLDYIIPDDIRLDDIEDRGCDSYG